MLTTTISDFRKNIKKYLNRVTDNSEILHIKRRKKADVIIISLDEYNSLLATQHELSSEINKKRLDSAIRKFKNKL